MFLGCLEYIGSIALTFCPARYRAGKELRNPTLASAVIEGFIASSFLVGRIYVYVPRAGMVSDKQAKDLFLSHAGKFMAANAIAGSANFLLDPINLLCLYFIFEALFRALAAVGGNGPVGTLPLYPVSILHGLWDKATHKRYLGKLIADEIVRGNGKQAFDLQVHSCRPKLDWNRYVTVEFEGEFYECYFEDQGPAPLRFIYHLRKLPIGRLAVVIRKYKADEVLPV